MGILELLKSDHHIRVTNANKWLLWADGEWQVYYRPYGARKTRVLYSGPDEVAAVAALMDGDE